MFLAHLLLTISLFSIIMDHHWKAPSLGITKVNCHGVTLDVATPNGNITGLAAILRRSNGNLISSIVGSVRRLSPLGNQLWAIFCGMRRAFLDTTRQVVVETDNLEAFGAIKFPNAAATPEIASIVQQIRILKSNSSWSCSILYVYPRRNRVATYLALLGAELFTRLFFFAEPLGRAAELMDLDIGLGPHDQDLIEAEMVEEELEQLEVALAAPHGPMEVGLAANFLAGAAFQLAPQAPENQEAEIHNFVFEDDLDIEEGGVAVGMLVAFEVT